jgi:ubiquinone/menaquinone biosynthesis C-methylase UbiE
MNDSANQFVGSIPENYDNGLGPNIFIDYADDLARRAGAAGASDVLELAAGTGIVSRRLRDALAPDARLTVTDLNPPMLGVAQAKFSDGEAVVFTPADAMALPFGDAQFDLIVCQFGVMFFPDKIASYREAARVLRPGGRYIFNTWGTMEANPFSLIAHEVTARFFPDDPATCGRRDGQMSSTTPLRWTRSWPIFRVSRRAWSSAIR